MFRVLKILSLSCTICVYLQNTNKLGRSGCKFYRLFPSSYNFLEKTTPKSTKPLNAILTNPSPQLVITRKTHKTKLYLNTLHQNHEKSPKSSPSKPSDHQHITRGSPVNNQAGARLIPRQTSNKFSNPSASSSLILLARVFSAFSSPHRPAAAATSHAENPVVLSS